MAGIAGRSYNVSGTGLNQYIFDLIADTGAGKEAMAKGIGRLFKSTREIVPASRDFEGPGEIASAQANYKIYEQGNYFICKYCGEFGIHLQQMAGTNAPVPSPCGIA